MKRMIFALVIGLLIGTASTAIAAQTDTVQAIFGKFTIAVDGEERQLEAEPLVYNNTVYLPLRAAADMLGLEVEYSAADKKIDLMTKEVSEMQTGYESLRTIAEKHEFTVSFNKEVFTGIEIGDVQLPIDFESISTLSESPTTIQTEYGDFRTYKQSEDILINISDWESVIQNINNQ